MIGLADIAPDHLLYNHRHGPGYGNKGGNAPGLFLRQRLVDSRLIKQIRGGRFRSQQQVNFIRIDLHVLFDLLLQLGVGLGQLGGARFDQFLKSRDAASGIRNFEDLERLACDNGMQLKKDVEMPVNNRLLIWQKA